MKLDAMNCTIFKADGGNTFEFAPTTRTECLTQTIYLAYPAASGNRLNLFNPPDNFKIFIHRS